MSKQALRVYLIKEGYALPEQIAKADDEGNFPPEGVRVHPLRQELGADGFLLLKQHRIGEPKWWSFVSASVVDVALEELQNSSTSAAIVLQAQGRWFAFTFGYGRTLLRDEVVVRDFGFVVALNRTDLDELRSLDSHTFEELSVHTRKQSSRGASFGTFGIDSTQDLMRALTGRSRDAAFGDTITGSDGLAISLDITVPNLRDRCDEFLRAYSSDEYTQDPRCAFIDKVRPVRDPALTSQLDGLLMEALINADATRLHLCPPEPFEWGADFGGFAYSQRRDEETSWELEPLSFAATLRPDPNIDHIRHRYIHVRSAESNRNVKSWSAYNCLVFETQLGDEHYVLTCGDWYRIQPDFVARVNEQAAAAVAVAPALPDTTEDEHEGVYNSRVSGEDFILLDCRCPTIDGSQVEVCDLLASQHNQLIHVKRWSSSATLSHLFRQGSNSGECLMSDPSYRQQVRARLADIDPALIDRIPAEDLDPADWEVVFAVAYPAHRQFPADLPFFTKLNLTNTAQHLRRLRFRVSLVRINQAPSAE
jgi:uncharacterized protein (TIGR04141 family)